MAIKPEHVKTNETKEQGQTDALQHCEKICPPKKLERAVRVLTECEKQHLITVATREI